MKKLKLFLLAAIAALSLTGCNMSIGLGNYNFEKVHIIAPSTEENSTRSPIQYKIS